MLEGHGDWSNYQRNAMSPDENDRESLEQMRLRTDDDEEELSAHLMDAERQTSYEEEFGPVAPNKDEVTFYSMSDPFAQHWNVMPTSPPR